MGDVCVGEGWVVVWGCWGEGACVRRFAVCAARMDLEGCLGEFVGSWVGGWLGVWGALWMG